MHNSHEILQFVEINNSVTLRPLVLFDEGTIKIFEIKSRLFDYRLFDYRNN